MAESLEKNYYGKRPMWQWVLLYLLIGVVVYGLVYYIFFAKKGGYNYSGSTYQNSSQYNYSK